MVKLLTKKRFIALACLTVALVIAIPGLILANQKEDTSTMVSKEASVTRGDIMISLSEEGTASVNTETTSLDLEVSIDDQNLDLDVTIDELLVRAGQVVTKGQPLFTIDQSSLTTALDTLDTQYQLAQLSLTQAQLNLQMGDTDAKATLASNKQSAAVATNSYDSDRNQLTLTQQQYEKNITDAEEDLIYYQKLCNTYDERTANLQVFKNLMTSSEENYDALQELYEDYMADNGDVVTSYLNAEKTADSLKETLESTYVDVTDITQYEDNPDYFESITNAQDEYSSVASQFNAAVKIINEYRATYDKSLDLEDQVDVASDTYTEAKEAYEEYSTEYKEMYGTMGKSDLSRKVNQLTIDLQTAQQTLADFQSDYEAKLIESENALNKTLTTANLADTSYQSTMNQLSLAVVSAQLKADNLLAYVTEMGSLLNDNVIISPCDGLVTNIPFAAGEQVNLVNQYITIAKPDQIAISLTIDQEDIGEVRLDQQAIVTFDAYSDRTYQGVVDAISISPAMMGAPTVNYTVTVVITGEDLADIYEGMSCQVELVLDRVEQVLTVSKRAITTENGQSYVNVKQADGTVIKQLITTGFTDGSNYEVLTGLNEGDTLLIQSQVSNANSQSQSSQRTPTESPVMPDGASRNP